MYIDTYAHRVMVMMMMRTMALATMMRKMMMDDNYDDDDGDNDAGRIHDFCDSYKIASDIFSLICVTLQYLTYLL